MGARVNINADAVHLFFLVDEHTRRNAVHLFFFSVGRAPGALRRYHVGAAGVAPHDDEKGEGVDATPPALQSRGAAANVADDTRCAPVRYGAYVAGMGRAAVPRAGPWTRYAPAKPLWSFAIVEEYPCAAR